MAAVAPSLTIHRLDVDAYDHMVASGALEGQPVELLEGLLVEVMSPQSPAHAAVIEELERHLASAKARLRTQLPLKVPPDAEPEPDLALVAEKPPPGQHPRTALLAVEVAVTSHEADRGLKAELYARAGVPTYWLVDVPGKAVEVRTDPGPDGYRGLEVYGLDGAVPCPVEGVADLDVGALLNDLGTE
ncbi:MAG: Uma2 family endonuclease [Acidimicrobiales bacterium]|jgi:Uma2 family endonuclease